jgi:Histidine-specific methyltransferase, SAM-dependent
MHLVSLEAQTVVMDGQSFDFATRESIHTETSRKYKVQTVSAIVRAPDGISRRCGPIPANYLACSASRLYKSELY